jgi:hypothetical protein
MQARSTSRRSPDSSNESELEFHASGFMVRVQGSCTKESLARFRHFLKLRRLSPSHAELTDAVERARQKYFEELETLYVCDERPCRGRFGFDTSDAALVAISRQRGLPVVRTGCQGICKQAPVASLRVGERAQAFAQIVTPTDWSALLNFADAAVRAGSLLVPPGGAEHLLHDPVHHHEATGAHLRPLTFLLGRFRGEGRYTASAYTFKKELVGSYEAGGRFIALRMDASYPTPDGQTDVHKALVIVGAEPSSGSITGRAYTDGGITHEYAVEQSAHALNFADAPPDHSSDWVRARKILQPTQYGFEERLEVDAGEGFTTYYEVPMHRMAAS